MAGSLVGKWKPCETISEPLLSQDQCPRPCQASPLCLHSFMIFFTSNACYLIVVVVIHCLDKCRFFGFPDKVGALDMHFPPHNITFMNLCRLHPCRLVFHGRASGGKLLGKMPFPKNHIHSRKIYYINT